VQPDEEPQWLTGVGGLLLVAAANETGLLPALEDAVASCSPKATSRLAHASFASSRMLILTLLFIHVAGLRRTWDLRRYTGDALGLLTGRKRAYGYAHVERFLRELCIAGGAQTLSLVLGKWATHLWQSSVEDKTTTDVVPCSYIDGHHKPVYTKKLIPRGLIGRTGKILGCRGLVLLHDEWGHPLQVSTNRGDQHLTIGLPQILAHMEENSGTPISRHVVVDREGMAAPFLKDLQAQGYIVITLLRTDQYDGLESFSEVGPFVPFEVDQHGQVIREVAKAKFALPLPDQPDQFLPLHVALIRDHRRQVPAPKLDDDEDDENDQRLARWREGWKAEPSPSSPTTAKLIPIVTTGETMDAEELAQTYIRRWPVQENVIKDYLLPLGLDTNHGFAKTEVENSEVTKKRTALEKRLHNVEQWAVKAKKRCENAGRLYDKRWKQTKAYGDEQYRLLNAHQDTLREQGMAYDQRRKILKEEQAQIDADLSQRWQQVWQTYDKSSKESEKFHRYAQQQCDLLRELEDLAATERAMYELDNRKDHIMTVFKVSLTNLVMWTRDRYFPQTYAHATWGRLLPFFQLPGLVTVDQNAVSVTFRPFNDKRLNQDLALLCERVKNMAPHLPDGKQILFTVGSMSRPVLDQHKQQVA
jgi:hypothetical protein